MYPKYDPNALFAESLTRADIPTLVALRDDLSLRLKTSESPDTTYAAQIQHRLDLVEQALQT